MMNAIIDLGDARGPFKSDHFLVLVTSPHGARISSNGTLEKSSRSSSNESNGWELGEFSNHQYIDVFVNIYIYMLCIYIYISTPFIFHHIRGFPETGGPPSSHPV